jgi:leucyl aminopeptidase (aminopeptidase T)
VAYWGARDVVGIVERACARASVACAPVDLQSAAGTTAAIESLLADGDALMIVGDASMPRERTAELVAMAERRRARMLHLPRADARILATSVRASPDTIERLQRRLAELCRMPVVFSLDEARARASQPTSGTTRWRVTSPTGTDLELTLDHRHPLVGGTGRPRPGDYDVAPTGYLHTYPSHVTGVLVADRLAFGSKVRATATQLRRAPLELTIKASRVTDARCADPELARAFEAYQGLDPYASRVGNVGFGTNPLALAELAHDVHDGVMAGVVVCLGDTARQITGAPYASSVLLRLGGRGQTVTIDGKTVIDRGRYVRELLDV